MSASTDSSFSRDRFIAKLTDFYEFLRQAYMPDHLFKWPPKEGWPELLAADLSFMNKDDIVLDTIRHMPYITCLSWEDPHEISPDTICMDYTSKEFRECIDKAANGEGTHEDTWNAIIDDPACLFPSDVFWLAQPSRAALGYFMVVDTTRDTVTLMEIFEGPEPNELSEPGAEEDGQRWREHATWKVDDFFEHMKDRFRSGDLLPTGWDSDDDPDDGVHVTRQAKRDAAFPEYMALLEKHGWSSEGFDKYICMPRLHRLMKGKLI